MTTKERDKNWKCKFVPKNVTEFGNWNSEIEKKTRKKYSKQTKKDERTPEKSFWAHLTSLKHERDETPFQRPMIKW